MHISHVATMCSVICMCKQPIWVPIQMRCLATKEEVVFFVSSLPSILRMYVHYFHEEEKKKDLCSEFLYNSIFYEKHIVTHTISRETPLSIVRVMFIHPID